jgi:hypothetical protein
MEGAAISIATREATGGVEMGELGMPCAAQRRQSSSAGATEAVEWREEGENRRLAVAASW